MELREWLIILGLALVSLIVIDGIRRLQRQRRVPRLDQAENRGAARDPEQAPRDTGVDWELPNGGARVIRPADYSSLGEKPPLERQAPEHPGPSRVLAGFRRSPSAAPSSEPRAQQTEPALTVPETPPATQADKRSPEPEPSTPADTQYAEQEQHAERQTTQGREQQAAADAALRADADDARAHQVSYRPAPRRQLRSDTVGDDDNDSDDEDAYRLVDIEGMSRSVKKRLVERRRARQQAKKRRQEDKARRAEARANEQAEREARRRQEQEDSQRRQAEKEAQAEQARQDAQIEQARLAEQQQRQADAPREQAPAAPGATGQAEDVPAGRHSADYPPMDPVLEKALRNDVPGGDARKTLSDADEIVVISVMSREAEGFDGIRLLKLLMACGLRYSQGLGVFHRFETESEDSELQFSMVNVVKPGSFPVEDGEPFTCPGVTFLMPLPGAEDSATAFEAMVETAMVVVRHMGGELKDENHSVMTAQTIEFARQRVHEFERRHRLHRHLQAQ